MNRLICLIVPFLFCASAWSFEPAYTDFNCKAYSTSSQADGANVEGEILFVYRLPTDESYIVGSLNISLNNNSDELIPIQIHGYVNSAVDNNDALSFSGDVPVALPLPGLYNMVRFQTAHDFNLNRAMVVMTFIYNFQTYRCLARPLMRG
jgi:hypothetical protein